MGKSPGGALNKQRLLYCLSRNALTSPFPYQLEDLSDSLVSGGCFAPSKMKLGSAYANETFHSLRSRSFALTISNLMRFMALMSYQYDRLSLDGQTITQLSFNVIGKHTKGRHPLISIISTREPCVRVGISAFNILV